jgi:AcrR family transcriptional regulator
MTRRYELKQRAESQTATRERIVEATVELHDSVGPARTTISAIAERAGVQRLTVYRHFPDEHSLFMACSGHWRANNPPPETSAWLALDDPEERLRVALTEIYAFYGATEGMTANLLRDLPDLPALQTVAAPFLDYWDTVRAVLERGWTARGRKRALLRAVIGHAVEFETWHSLVRRQGLDDAVAVDAMVSLARAVRTPPRKAAGKQSRTA